MKKQDNNKNTTKKEINNQKETKLKNTKKETEKESKENKKVTPTKKSVKSTTKQTSKKDDKKTKEPKKDSKDKKKATKSKKDIDFPFEEDDESFETYELNEQDITTKEKEPIKTLQDFYREGEKKRKRIWCRRHFGRFNKNKKIIEASSRAHAQISSFIESRYPKLRVTKKIDLEYRINFVGWFIYERIYEFLKINGYKKIEPALIESILVYDKRLKNLLFKYVGIIEEYYRAKLYNIYTREKCDIIEKCPFHELITRLESEKVFKEVIPGLRDIKELRNEICHHNLLLIDQESQLNLKNVQSIFMIKELIINDDIRDAFIYDINNAPSKKSTKELYNKIYRTIPKFLRIKL